MVSGASAHYQTTSVYNMSKLDVKSIAAPDCILFMWWVGSQPREALFLLDVWQFRLRTMSAFTWSKLTKNGLPWFGMGFLTRQGAENCLAASRGKPNRKSASIRSVVEAVAGRHSEKPPLFRHRIERLMGDVPRIELFARERVAGWDCWGNEVTSDVDIPVVEHQPYHVRVFESYHNGHIALRDAAKTLFLKQKDFKTEYNTWHWGMPL